MPKAMERLRDTYGELVDIRSAVSLLGWDQQTYMPPRGSATRGRQIATLSSLIHERLLSPVMEGQLKGLNGDSLTEDDRYFIAELEFDRDRARRIPAAHVEEVALVTTEAFEAWVTARREKNFSVFAPHLQRIINLRRKEADYYGFDEHPWDALVQDYERGMTASKMRAIFEILKKGTLDLLGKIRSAKPRHDFRFLDRKWDTNHQWDFGMRVLRDLGFDFEAGRQDRSAHPFTSAAGPLDVRLTTRLLENNLFNALGSTIHEAGHGLYEQGFLLEDYRTPLGGAPSFGMHESQSRLWEIRIGQSKPFWQHYLPLLRTYFKDELASVDLDTFYAASNIVTPSFIRVEADEITYNLHIILRFELELEMMAGTLKAVDLPQAWNARIHDLLGITPPDDAIGCMQDVHWSHGSFGYFPSYTLGNVYAAMLMEKIEEDIPGLWAQVEQGHFDALLRWLRENVHRHGRRYQSEVLIKRITGRTLDCSPLLNYLNRKYRDLYGF